MQLQSQVLEMELKESQQCQESFHGYNGFISAKNLTKSLLSLIFFLGLYNRELHHRRKV